jgi:hypothetical protein
MPHTIRNEVNITPYLLKINNDTGISRIARSMLLNNLYFAVLKQVQRYAAIVIIIRSLIKLIVDGA